ncbi:hypothetical protein MHH28_10465 [Paenibacillus sp. FSL K6-1217]|uniref:hypothetical protein n=1 Tax=Paenibacillus sp. FSL K6-1217 TaxID=2921466 RepID=UPI003249D379
MSKSSDARQDQNPNAKEAAEFQNQTIREFVEEKAGNNRTKGPVDESTARLPDDQNRLISQHNLRK